MAITEFELLFVSTRLFDVPSDVTHLNAAGWSLPPRATQEAGARGRAAQGPAVEAGAGLSDSRHDRARKAAAALIGADASDVALGRRRRLRRRHCRPVLNIPAQLARAGCWRTITPRRCSNGSAGRNSRAIGRDDQAARERGLDSATLEAIEKPGALPLALALDFVRSTGPDGGLLDMEKIRPRKQNTALLLDATHSVGVIKTDMKALDPDFLIFPTPAGTRPIRARVRLRGGGGGEREREKKKKKKERGRGGGGGGSAIRRAPLEQTSFGRRNVKAENPSTSPTRVPSPTRARYDMGERDHFISMEMAAIGMEMMAEWGADAVAGALGSLTGKIADDSRRRTTSR